MGKKIVKVILQIFTIAFVTSVCLCTINCSSGQKADSWETARLIREQIKAPVFPDRDFVITDFGAIGDGKTDCSEAFRKAIETCSQSGGGRVVVPPGRFYTGAIHLKSNVNLHIRKNGEILFSTNPDNYLPVVLTRFEGVELMNYSPLIYAFGQENIAVTGSGVLNGQADSSHWWPWVGVSGYGWKRGEPSQKKARDSLFAMASRGVPPEKRIFGQGHYLRPNFIQLYRCENILIEDVTITASPMWIIHPVLSENITVRGVRVISHGPNNDGCNPESSKNVLIEDSYFDTGDDCIAIKSGRNEDGRRIGVPSENIVVRNCVMAEGHGGVVMGSECSGGIRNVFIENCVMDSPHLDRALRIKTNSLRGGLIEKIYMRDVKIGQVREAVLKVNFLYEKGDVGKFTPVVRDILMERVTSQKSRYALWIKGYERSPVKNIVLRDCSFDNVADSMVLDNVVGLKMENVFINGKKVK